MAFRILIYACCIKLWVHLDLRPDKMLSDRLQPILPFYALYTTCRRPVLPVLYFVGYPNIAAVQSKGRLHYQVPCTSSLPVLVVSP